jgi:hypothetical protein
MPSPSFFPMVASFGLLVSAYGMILGRSNGANYLVTVVGLLIVLGGLYAWALEPSAEPEEHVEAADHPALVGAGVGALAAGAGGSAADGAETGAIGAGREPPAPKEAGGASAAAADSEPEPPPAPPPPPAGGDPAQGPA